MTNLYGAAVACSTPYVALADEQTNHKTPLGTDMITELHRGTQTDET